MRYARSRLVHLSDRSDPLSLPFRLLRFFTHSSQCRCTSLFCSLSTSQSFMVAIFTFDFDAQLHADAAAFFILSMIFFPMFILNLLYVFSHPSLQRLSVVACQGLDAGVVN